MKKSYYLFLVAVIAVTTLINGCKKEEKTLTNLWKLTSYSYDGVTQNIDREYTFDIKEDKSYASGPYLFADSPGTWALSSDKKTLILYTKTGWTHNLNILKIKNKEFWFQTNFPGSTMSEEYHWVPK